MNSDQQSPEAKNEAMTSRAKMKLEEYLTWSDELPDEIVRRGDLQYNKHKFRTNWFTGVFSNCKFIAQMKGDRKFMQEIQTVMNKWGGATS